jgi:hypothetical protein
MTLSLRLITLALGLLLLSACSHMQNFGQRCEAGAARDRDKRPCPSFETAVTYADAKEGSGASTWTWGASGRWSEGPKLGIALSGGGSKASPIAMGVLAGLSDLDLLLPKGGGGVPEDSVVASVSGGGYAAYHLFSQLTWYQQQAPGERPADTLHRAYRDCLEPPGKGFHAGLLAYLREAKVFCDSVAPSDVRQASLLQPQQAALPQRLQKDLRTQEVVNAEQFKVKCGQDLLQAGECALGTDAGSTLWGTAAILVPTFLSLPAHHLFNTAFDSGLSVAPSRQSYKDGIGLTYGSVAERNPPATGVARFDPVTYLDCPVQGGAAAVKNGGRFRPDTTRCEVVPLSPHHDHALAPGEQQPFYLGAQDVDFGQLRKLRGRPGGADAPLWIIQATATRHRSFWGLFANPTRDIPRDTFEISPYWHGSLRYGFMRGEDIPNLSVLDATTAAAAFFDVHQQSVTQGRLEAAIGMLLHAANINWGHDIPNYNVSETRKAVHRVLPFPLYWMDSALSQITATEDRQDAKARRYGQDPHDPVRSAYIRLNDGGNSDNTGAYSLIRRGMRAVVIADAAQDGEGSFGDLCNLATALRSDPDTVPLYLSIPGLKGFDADCAKQESYDLFRRWPHQAPVLLGCVGADAADPCRPTKAAGVTRLVIVKPRIDWNRVQVREALSQPGGVRQCVQDGMLRRVGAKAAGEANPFRRAVLWAGADAGPGRTQFDCKGQNDPASEAYKQCAQAVPCEVARFFVDSPGLRFLSPWNKFPQNPTAMTTVDSGPALFTASRDLARHYVHLARVIIEDALGHGQGAFARTLAQQAAKPVLPTCRPEGPADCWKAD